MTIFLTMHYMDEAEYADRLAIIDHGSIVASGTPDELKRQVGADTVELITADNRAASAHLQAAGMRVRGSDELLVVFAEDGEALVAAAGTAGSPERCSGRSASTARTRRRARGRDPGARART